MPRSKRTPVTRSKVRFAPVEAVEDFIAEASGQVLACRDRKHGWKLLDIEGARDIGFIRYYRCACKAVLTQTIAPSGLVVSRRTKYPKNYQMPPGTGRLSRDTQGLIRIASAEADMRTFMMRKAVRKAS